MRTFDSYSAKAERPVAGEARKAFLVRRKQPAPRPKHMADAPRKGDWKRWLLAWSVLFALCYVLCFHWFWDAGKALFRDVDGLNQHYMFFVYIGRWLRKIARSVLSGEGLQVPLWDMAMGYGSDIPTTLAAYLPDPFNWVSVLVPARYAEVAFELTLALKVWLCGVAFGFLARERGMDRFAALCGATIYAFSATTYIVFIESFFINPLYLFPFVIAGADRIWEGKGSGLYIGTLALTCINYFYFAYMTAIFIVGWYLLNLVEWLRDGRGLRDALRVTVRFVLASLAAAGISAVVTLPVLKVMTGVGRLGVEYWLPALYPKEYYAQLPAGLVTFVPFFGRDAYAGFAPVVLPGILLALMTRGHAKEKVALAILTVFMCLPLAGSVLNGFSYYANRWIWAYTLVVAMLFAASVSEVAQVDRRRAAAVVLATAAYYVAAGSLAGGTPALKVSFVLAMLGGALCACSRRLPGQSGRLAMTLLVVVSVASTADFHFSDKFGDAVVDQVAAGTAYQSITESAGLPLLNEVPHESGWRYDCEGVPLVWNASWVYGMSGSDLYISVYNGAVDQFHRDIGLCSGAYPGFYRGLDRRSELEALMGVRYYLAPRDEARPLPVGFDSAIQSGSFSYGQVTLWEREEAAPSLLFYRDAISRDSWMSLDAHARQRALTRACVVEDGATTAAQSLALPDDSVDCQTSLSEGVSQDGRDLVVSAPGAQMTVSFAEVSDCEVYVWLEGLDFSNDGQAGSSISVAGMRGGRPVDSANAGLGIRNWRSHMYGGRHDWLMNLGLASSPIDAVTITFNKAGTYSLDDVRIYAEPRAEIESSLAQMVSAASQLEIGTNTIGAQIDVPEDGWALLSIPYSEGWKATLDGAPVQMERADDAFMTLRVKKGRHTLSMSYCTPGLAAGLAISVVSLCASVAACAVARKRQKD